ncbi:MAG: hypothetical protein ABI280_00190 [Ginsengibacter sp.]
MEKSDGIILVSCVSESACNKLKAIKLFEVRWWISKSAFLGVFATSAGEIKDRDNNDLPGIE